MAETNLTGDSLKEAVKQALIEALKDQRELLSEVFSEVLEDFALAEAIREGGQSDTASEEEVASILRRRA